MTGPISGEAVRRFGAPVAILAFQAIFFPLPAGLIVRGVVIGLVTGLIALGMALIYRSHQTINIAQSDLGSVPTAFAVYLIVFSGVSYWLGLIVGLLGAALIGALVELLFIRRFRHASRVVMTVATVGVAQVLVAASLLLPRIWGERPQTQALDVPWDIRWRVDPLILGGDDILALIVAPLAMVALAVWLRRTDVGLAVRASAERADRASLLGIPVGRVQTLVWVVAALLSFTGAWLRAGVVGLPILGSALTLGVLLRVLAALVIGRMHDLPAIAATAVALGLLEFGMDWRGWNPQLLDPVLAAVILVALLVQHGGRSRWSSDGIASWQEVDEVRPIPAVLRRLPEVRIGRFIGWSVVALVVLGLPHRLNAADSLQVSAGFTLAILAASLLVLTGWSGQLSLGQSGFAGIGGAVGAWTTINWNADLFVSLIVGGLCGAFAAVLVGLPALRLRGQLLLVTTFAFGLTTWSWLLNRQFFDWIPTERVPRLPLFGRIAYDSPTGIYYVTLVVTGLVALALVGIRRSRFGRAVIALRENDLAAQAVAVSPVRLKLTAFALSGFVAAVSGSLFVHHQQSFGGGLFSPFAGLAVFTSAVIGGLGSLLGVALGATYFTVIDSLLPREWQFFVIGAGVLSVLMITPSGLGGLVFRIRDGLLRGLARRHDLLVPSLLADRADRPEPTPEEVG